MGGPLTMNGRDVIRGIKAKLRWVWNFMWVHTVIGNKHSALHGCFVFWEGTNSDIPICGICWKGYENWFRYLCHQSAFIFLVIHLERTLELSVLDIIYGKMIRDIVRVRSKHEKVFTMMVVGLVNKNFKHLEN